jgi:hypothetical protein
VLLSFTKDAMAVLGDSEVVKELNVHCTKMTMEDAILLFYTGNYTEAQWDSMALAVNKQMKPELRKKQGLMVPCMKTLSRQYAAKHLSCMQSACLCCRYSVMLLEHDNGGHV